MEDTQIKGVTLTIHPRTTEEVKEEDSPRANLEAIKMQTTINAIKTHTRIVEVSTLIEVGEDGAVPAAVDTDVQTLNTSLVETILIWLNVRLRAT